MPINFDELEMKRYTGNVSFIMDINDVDVTPSRESVIWNTKTRDAIKNMFIEAQNTIKDVIAEKIKDAKTLAEHLNMLESFKNKNSVSGLGELYKVVDISDINLKYGNFSLTNAAKELEDKKLSNNLIFTSTETNNGYNVSVKDTNYDSKLSKKYLSYLSPLHNNFKQTVVYIGKVKYKDIARYIYKKYSQNSYGEDVNIIYIHDETFEILCKEAKINDKFDVKEIKIFFKLAHSKTNQINILFAEILIAITKGMNVLFERDVDKKEMKNLAEKEAELTSRGYISASERAKLENKILCSKVLSSYKQKDYYNEDDITSALNAGSNVVIYKMKNTLNMTLVKDRYRNEYRSNKSMLHNYLILGVSDEGFKRFYKIPGVKILTDIIFNIEFGDFSLTEIGEFLLVETKTNKVLSEDYDLLYYLNDSFAAIKINNYRYKKEILERITKLQIKVESHKRENKLKYITNNK